MSELYVDNIKNRTGGPIGIPTGAVVTGVITATEFIGTAATVGSGTTINSSGVNVSGFVTAAYFVGDGSGLVNVATNSVEGFTVNNNGTLVGIAQTIDFGSNLDVSPAQAGFVTVTTSSNVTGNLTGDVTGDVTGNVTGNLTGDVTGNITGTAGTFNSVVKVGTAITADATSGIITATKFVGDGSELTNLGNISVLTSDTDLENGKTYMINASGLLLTLPASPSTGDAIDILNNVTGIHTVARNGSTIQSLSEDMELNTQGIQFKIWYTGSTWSLF